MDYRIIIRDYIGTTIGIHSPIPSQAPESYSNGQLHCQTVAVFSSYGWPTDSWGFRV